MPRLCRCSTAEARSRPSRSTAGQGGLGARAAPVSRRTTTALPRPGLAARRAFALQLQPASKLCTAPAIRPTSRASMRRGQVDRGPACLPLGWRRQVLLPPCCPTPGWRPPHPFRPGEQHARAAAPTRRLWQVAVRSQQRQQVAPHTVLQDDPQVVLGLIPAAAGAQDRGYEPPRRRQAVKRGRAGAWYNCELGADLLLGAGQQRPSPRALTTCGSAAGWGGSCC